MAQRLVFMCVFWVLLDKTGQSKGFEGHTCEAHALSLSLSSLFYWFAFAPEFKLPVNTQTPLSLILSQTYSTVVELSTLKLWDPAPLLTMGVGKFV